MWEGLNTVALKATMVFARADKDTTLAPTENPPKLNETTFLAVVWIAIGVATSCVALRGFLRLKYNGRFQLDDLFTLFAHLLLVALGVLYTVGHADLFYIVRLAAGQLPPPTTEAGLLDLISKAEFMLKQSFAGMICFWSCLWMVKASFLAFFYPLSEGLLWDRRLWYTVVTFVSLSYIAIIIDFPLTCGNGKDNFRFEGCNTDRDVQLEQLSLRMSTALDILTDVSIIIIPWKILFIVRKSFKEKLAVSCIVGLGVFIILFSVIRVIVTNTNHTSPDPTWLEVWSALEASVAVTVVSLTSLKVFIAKATATSGYDSRVMSGRAPRSTRGFTAPSKQSGRMDRSWQGAIPLDDVSQAGSELQFRSDYHAEVRKGSASHASDEVLV